MTLKLNERYLNNAVMGACLMNVTHYDLFILLGAMLFITAIAQCALRSRHERDQRLYLEMLNELGTEYTAGRAAPILQQFPSATQDLIAMLHNMGCEPTHACPPGHCHPTDHNLNFYAHPDQCAKALQQIPGKQWIITHVSLKTSPRTHQLRTVPIYALRLRNTADPPPNTMQRIIEQFSVT